MHHTALARSSSFPSISALETFSLNITQHKFSFLRQPFHLKHSIRSRSPKLSNSRGFGFIQTIHHSQFLVPSLNLPICFGVIASSFYMILQICWKFSEFLSPVRQESQFSLFQSKTISPDTNQGSDTFTWLLPYFYTPEVIILQIENRKIHLGTKRVEIRSKRIVFRQDLYRLAPFHHPQSMCSVERANQSIQVTIHKMSFTVRHGTIYYRLLRAMFQCLCSFKMVYGYLLGDNPFDQLWSSTHQLLRDQIIEYSQKREVFEENYFKRQDQGCVNRWTLGL